MARVFIRNISVIAVLLAILLVLSGCESALTGKYETEGGAVTIDFQSGKAVVTTFVSTIVSEYEIRGDIIILKQMGLSLTRNPDGTLSSILGTLARARL